MEMQIIIFLAFVSVALIVNAFLIFFTYKAFANMTQKVTEAALQYRSSNSTLALLETVKSASARSVELTAGLKERITSCEPGLRRAHSRLGYGLAVVDIRFEKILEKVHKETEKAQSAIIRPTRRFGAAAAGVREVMRMISESGNVDDANPTLNEQSVPNRSS